MESKAPEREVPEVSRLIRGEAALVLDEKGPNLAPFLFLVWPGHVGGAAKLPDGLALPMIVPGKGIATGDG